MEVFRFGRKQVVFEIGGVKVGGEMGENPTVMIGSIFYKGDKTIEDEAKGEFNREEAERLISKAEEISDRTGLPAMLDVICTNPENAERYLRFAADATEMPILIDSASDEAAVRALEVVDEIGIKERVVFNSINPETREPIYRKIEEVGLKSAVLLTYSVKAIVSSTERIKVLEALLPRVKAAGIEKMLIDTVVVDISTLGPACRAIRKVKERFGYPAGCAAHNSVSSWRALRKRKDPKLTAICSSVVNSLPVALGADFILYGPLKEAEYLFQAICLVDAAYGQILIEDGRRPGPSHPRFKISRLFR